MNVSFDMLIFAFHVLNVKQFHTANFRPLQVAFPEIYYATFTYHQREKITFCIATGSLSNNLFYMHNLNICSFFFSLHLFLSILKTLLDCCLSSCLWHLLDVTACYNMDVRILFYKENKTGA
jgi:hypothetical protein